MDWLSTNWLSTNWLETNWLETNWLGTNWIWLWKGLAIGFAVAAPVGPVGVLCVRRTLAGGAIAGLLTGLGAASADAVYGSIAGFGLAAAARWLTAAAVPLQLAGGAFLLFLGARTFAAGAQAARRLPPSPTVPDPTVLDPTVLDSAVLDSAVPDPSALDSSALDSSALDPFALDPPALDPSEVPARHDGPELPARSAVPKLSQSPEQKRPPLPLRQRPAIAKRLQRRIAQHLQRRIARRLAVGASLWASTFFLTLTNPLTILAFASIFAGLGLGRAGGEIDGAAAGLVGGVFLGSALWWLLLSFGTCWLGDRLNLAARADWIDRASGVLVAAFGAIALGSALGIGG